MSSTDYDVLMIMLVYLAYKITDEAVWLVAGLIWIVLFWFDLIREKKAKK